MSVARGQMGVGAAANGDVNLACAWALVDALVRGGVEHACISPGSRSTPLALALDRHPAITTHIHLDERSSAFFAIGLAKASHRPIVVACTSGTAAAELFPAVVEASQSRMPLILLTADRPPRLRGTGANQTIDQVELYGRHARAYFEPPVPSSEGDATSWAEVGDLAIGAARFGAGPDVGVASLAGPVQVDCCFEEPLVPEGVWIPRQTAAAGTTERAYALPWIDHSEAIEALTSSERGLVVVGSLTFPATDVLDLAERLRWPVLAEPTSNLRIPGRTLAAGQALASSDVWTETMRPDVVVQFGTTPTARATQRLIASAEHLVVVAGDEPDPDPEARATLRVNAWRPGIASELLAQLPPELAGTHEWSTAWHRADEAARRAVDRSFDEDDRPFEPRVGRDLAAAIPDGGTLVVGSSMPIRDLDLAMSPRDGLRVLANRGASGIDGFVSTALGVAASGTPTFALCGDLTFLHDVGALMWNARRGLDAVVVVSENGGGSIFGLLPQRDLPEFERLFETPHGLDLGEVCAAAGAGHTKVARATDLLPAIRDAEASGGVRVVEITIDADLDRAGRADLREAVDAAIGSLPTGPSRRNRR